MWNRILWDRILINLMRIVVCCVLHSQCPLCISKWQEKYASSLVLLNQNPTCVALLLYSSNVGRFLWLLVLLSIPYSNILLLSISYF